MKLIETKNYDELSRVAADMLISEIKAKPDCVLGLATGSTPIGTYDKLIEAYKSNEVSFAKVKSINLDEYVGISWSNTESYRYFMNEHLFDHVDIDKSRTHVPDGLAKDPAAMGQAYDAAIEAAGGIDLQVLGLGPNGHIAFNEPEEELYAGTHLTGLTESTIKANSRFFEKIEDVPTQAVTMGIGSIMKARKIIVLASGKGKHPVIEKMLSGRITTQCPGTLLLAHADVTLIVDKDAFEG